jgi:hypothetical protein
VQRLRRQPPVEHMLIGTVPTAVRNTFAAWSGRRPETRPRCNPRGPPAARSSCSRPCEIRNPMTHRTLTGAGDLRRRVRTPPYGLLPSSAAIASMERLAPPACAATGAIRFGCCQVLASCRRSTGPALNADPCRSVTLAGRISYGGAAPSRAHRLQLARIGSRPNSPFGVASALTDDCAERAVTRPAS